MTLLARWSWLGLSLTFDRWTNLALWLSLAAWLLAACGGGGNAGAGPTAAPPEIMTPPQAAAAPDGASVTFSVAARGEGTLRYQWLRDGNVVAGAVTDTLVLAAVAMSDDGASFSVRVSNDGGSVTSSPAALTVTPVAPQVISQPRSVSVQAGQSADFDVVARGTGPLAYQWLRNGTPLAGATTTALRIAAVALGDDGDTFAVVVRGPGGTVNSDAATLRVTVAAVPPRVITQPQDLAVSQGQEAAFVVSATGTAPLAFQWQRDGVDITGATGPGFTLAAAALADSGAAFRVRITNDAGSVLSRAALLTVNALVPPSIATSPASQTVAVGQKATFSVAANGSAPLVYQWRRNGVAIAGATAHSYTTPTVTLADNGARYSVEVDNATGQSVTSAEATLTVNAAAPGPLSPDDYLVAGSAGDFDGSRGRLFLALADPTSPAAARLASQLQAVDSEPLMPRSFTRNGAGEVVEGPAPYAYFIRGGMLYRVNLKRGANPTPRRLSAIDNACALVGAQATRADASEAVLTVWTQGSIGGCGADDNTYFVRSTAATATPGVRILRARRPLLPLINADTNALGGWLVWDTTVSPSRFRTLAADLTTLREVDNGAAARVSSMAVMGGDPADAQSVFLQIDDLQTKHIRRFSWTSTGARLSDSLYTFGSRSSAIDTRAWASDASGTYFVDNHSLVLLRLRGANPAQLVRDMLTDGLRAVTSYLYLTPDHVVVRYVDPATSEGVAAIGKSGDTFRTLVAPVNGTLVLPNGVSGAEVVYISRTASSGLVTIRRVAAGGGSPVSIASNVRLVANMPARELQRGAFDPRAQRDGSPPYGPPPVARLKALLYCAPAAGIEDCRRSAIYRYDVATGTSVRVATLDDGLTRLDSFTLSFDWTEVGTPAFAWPLYADLPGMFYSLAFGAGTPPEGGFVANGRWADRFLLTSGPAARAHRVTQLTP